MSRDLLRQAAAQAGITEEQAEAFVRAVIHPTHQMCHQAGQHSYIPPFVQPAALEKAGVPYPADWDGLTSGEFEYTKYAHIWRLMAAGMLLDEPRWSWASDQWPHPRSDFDGERIAAAQKSPF